MVKSPLLLPLVVVPLLAVLGSPRPQEDPDLRDMAPTPRPKIVPCLWFAERAEEALDYYGSIFAESEVLDVTRAGPEGPLIAARMRLAGHEFMLLNGNPGSGFNEAVSLVVNCATQAEIDELWGKLTADGGRPGRCGWLRDRLGVSWQIVPASLGALLGDPDPVRARRVADALMGMDKLDLGRLERARDGR